MDYLTNGLVGAFKLLLDFDPATYSAIYITLKLSVISMIFSLAIGIPLGFILGHFDFFLKRQLRIFFDTMLALPTVVVGLVVYAFVSHRGPLGNLNLMFTVTGMAIGQAILAIPIVVSLTATAVESLDNRLKLNLMTLGASGMQIAIASLREARFAVLTASVTAFGRVIAEVGVSMMIGGNVKWHTRTITTAIALETGMGEFAMGLALGIVLLLMAFIVNWLLVVLRRR